MDKDSHPRAAYSFRCPFNFNGRFQLNINAGDRRAIKLTVTVDLTVSYKCAGTHPNDSARERYTIQRQ